MFTDRQINYVLMKKHCAMKDDDYDYECIKILVKVHVDQLMWNVPKS